MKKIVAAKMPVRNREALVTVLYEDGRPLECFVRGEHQESPEGSIYTGLVEKVDRRLSAAFVRIGKDMSGYLPLEKARNAIICGRRGAAAEDAKKQGSDALQIKPQDEILVMVEKAAVKTKHCVLTCELSVSGKYLVVYSSKAGKAGFSRKLSKAERSSLKDELADLRNRQTFDLTFRTCCANADPGKITAEYEHLEAVMERIVRFGPARPYGTCLYSGSRIEEKMLKKLDADDLQELVTDSPDLCRSLREEICPALSVPAERIRLYSDPMIDLYKLYNFSTLIDRITSEKIMLHSGITLNIEMTEAFTVIDVNSAGSTEKYRKAASFLPLNKEAAEGIAEQIRLRQLSGIILIDFISMESKEEEEELIRFFRDLTSNDPVRTSVVDITKLGIMEVTREKRYRNIREQIALL